VERGESASEIAPGDKNRISHRGRAIAELLQMVLQSRATERPA